VAVDLRGDIIKNSSKNNIHILKNNMDDINSYSSEAQTSETKIFNTSNQEGHFKNDTDRPQPRADHRCPS